MPLRACWSWSIDDSTWPAHLAWKARTLWTHLSLSQTQWRSTMTNFRRSESQEVPAQEDTIERQFELNPECSVCVAFGFTWTVSKAERIHLKIWSNIFKNQSVSKQHTWDQQFIVPPTLLNLCWKVSMTSATPLSFGPWWTILWESPGCPPYGARSSWSPCGRIPPASGSEYIYYTHSILDQYPASYRYDVWLFVVI
jgi:hypothetical protein